MELCNTPNGTLSHGAPCPQSNWLVYVLSALYLLISQILLLNILIAIFKYVILDTKADVRHATKLSNFVAQLYCATNLPRQLSIFHWQTIAK